MLIQATIGNQWMRWRDIEMIESARETSDGFLVILKDGRKEYARLFDSKETYEEMRDSVLKAAQNRFAELDTDRR